MNWEIRRRYRRIVRHLATAGPGQLVMEEQKRILRTFRRAARHVPAYGRILEQHGVDPAEITSVEAFKQKVPIIDKETIFSANELRDLCIDGHLDDVASFYSSSGHTGVFSFGVETWEDAQRIPLGLEFALHNTFRVLDRKTLVINCLPMGIKIHTRTLPLAETGVRADVIWAIIRKVKDDFDQFLLIGEHLFLKELIEGGPDNGVSWKDLVVHIITGAEYIAENFRGYLASLLGVDFDRPEKGIVGVNFGLSELSLSIFRENSHTVRIRRLAHGDHDFRRALYGRDMPSCPNIMQYNPHQAFIETVRSPEGRSELVVTMVAPDMKLPLIRYNTKDVVELMTHEALAGILREHGHESLLPPLHLPVGMICGKCKPLTTPDGQEVHPEEVKEAIYFDHEVAGNLTGNFRLCLEKGGVTLLVQLREGGIRVRLLPYREFPYGFIRDFERKPQYV